LIWKFKENLALTGVRRSWILRFVRLKFLSFDRIEIHVDAIQPGDRVLLVDDLIATGGTAEAAAGLIQEMGGEVVECCFVIDLPDVGGRARLEKLGHKVFALCEFSGD